MRSNCVQCGAMLQGRAWPPKRWGTWCPRCHGWWPDHPDGTRANDEQPPAYELNDTPTGTKVRAVDQPEKP